MNKIQKVYINDSLIGERHTEKGLEIGVLILIFLLTCIFLIHRKIKVIQALMMFEYMIMNYQKKKEIKEISKAKILHYNFNNFSTGKQNLILNFFISANVSCFLFDNNKKDLNTGLF